MAADNVIDISIGAVELRYVKELPSAAQFVHRSEFAFG